MTIRRAFVLVVLAGVVGVASALALAGPRGDALAGTSAPTLPIAGTESSVAGVVRSVHGYAFWKDGGPDLYPETARQVDCLVTDGSLSARMVVSVDRPDPLTIRFGYRPAKGPIVTAVAGATPARVRGMSEFVATLVVTPPGKGPSTYPKGARERCWAVLGHQKPVKLPGRP